GDQLVELNELPERSNRVTGTPLDLRRACHVAEHERVWSAAVQKAERNRGVQRVTESSLPLDELELAAEVGALDDEALGGSGHEVRDDGVDGDAPAGDGDPGLARRDEDGLEPATARFDVELDGDGLLADRAIGADRQDDLRVDLEALTGPDVQ